MAVQRNRHFSDVVKDIKGGRNALFYEEKK